MFVKNEYERSTLLGLQDIGIHVLQTMYEVTTGTMWAAAQVTLYQQRKTLKYMRHGFGRRIIIQEIKVQQMGINYVLPQFGVYYFKKDPTTKPEKINYWTRSLPDLLLQ